MPVNEFAGDDSWGYNPAFFYAVESAYGGPESLKRLVDVCHEHGIAVLVDVVFNHAGTSDNALWSVARDSFFKGDTAWGALINFAHPQAGHFFEQNLRFLIKHYHVDGFRFDHTWTIRYSDRVGRVRNEARQSRRMEVSAQDATCRPRREHRVVSLSRSTCRTNGISRIRRPDGQPVVRRFPRPARRCVSRAVRNAPPR